jgi:hypothetical protein
MENENAVQNGIRSSTTRGELAKALAKAQGQLQSAGLNSTNPHFRYDYADLHSVVRACRKPMVKNGLSIAQFPGRTENKVMELITVLMHDSGEWLEYTLTMPLDKITPQGYGAAVSYARRYSFQSVMGVVTGEDDDAETIEPTSNGLQDSRGASSPPEQAEREAHRPTNGKKVMTAVKFREWLVLEHKFKNVHHVQETMKNLDFWPTPSSPEDRKRCSAALAEYRVMRDLQGVSKDEAIANIKEAENES